MLGDDDGIWSRTPLWLWLMVGGCLIALACLLAWVSPLFGYDYSLKQLPSRSLAAGLGVAGLIYLLVPVMIRGSLTLPPAAERRLLLVIVALGLVMRLVLMGSEPALEDDYQRYMWDGAAAANGLNPYAISPVRAADEPLGSPLRDLVRSSGVVHDRINHPGLKTIYPPVAQAAFMLAYFIKPWSLVAWRTVCLAGEIASLLLLLALLRETGRSPLWLALYWWNPIAVKELINSAHMEAILIPLVLAAALLAIRRRVVVSTLFLGLAAGAKIWPVMLAPLIWRHAISRPKLVIGCALMLGAMLLLWAWPAYVGGIDGKSGFVAYAQRWKTASALFPQVEHLAGWLIAAPGWQSLSPALTARGILALLLGSFVLWQAWPPLRDGQDLMQRFALSIAALFLISPSQYPWYLLWLLPFLCFMPSFALLAITATIPLYYVAFYFIAHDRKEVFADVVVWFIWLPIWGLIASELWWRAIAWRRWPSRPIP